jgi:hypothetical protein
VSQHPLKVVKVPFAAKWTERMREGFDSADASPGGGANKGDGATAVAAQQLTADWTFSSDYVCTLLSGCHGKDGSVALDDVAHQQPCGSGVVVRARELPSVERENKGLVSGFRTVDLSEAHDPPAQVDQSPSAHEGSWRVEAVAESGVDYSMLRRQDEPILFYDEAILYQVSSDNTKLR